MTTVPIYVPTYQRPHLLVRQTLPLLRRLSVPSASVFVVVADNTERELYRGMVPRDLYAEILVAAPGLRAARNWIQRHAMSGEHIIQFDDDIEQMLVTQRDGKQHHATPEEWHALVNRADMEMRATGLRLWGVHPVNNPFFHRIKSSTSLNYISGCVFGLRVSHDAKYQLDTEHMLSLEDRERTCRYFAADGGVIRYNWWTYKTQYWRADGGLHSIGRTTETTARDADRLVAQWPDMVRVRTKRNGMMDVAFKRGGKHAPA